MRRQNSPLIACLLLGLFLITHGPVSGAEEPAWSLEHMMKQWQSTGERHTRFTEVRELALLEQPIQQTGTLVFQPPDRLIRTLSPPSDTRYEIEGNRLILWQGDQQQTLLLDNLPELLAFSASFRSVLGGDIETLTTFFTPKLSGDHTAWTLTLDPKQKELAAKITQIEIDGREFEIDRYRVIETNGDQIITHLTPIQE
ncbi:MAG: outer membrane lipoprotein carrier protein LolA [Candidatus Thiodiazotropha sp. L084R]